MYCLIDTGASINLISEDYDKENAVFEQLPLQKPKYNDATTADGNRIAIIGFLSVPVQILGSKFTVQFHVTRALHQKIIIDSEFLSSQKALLDFSTSLLRIYNKNQLRTTSKITIPPLSQTVCKVRVKNSLPSGTIGHCHGGRNIQNIGLVLANTISCSRFSPYINGSTVTVMVLNLSINSITLFPRTKVGTFTVVHDLSHFANIDDTDINNIDIQTMESPLLSETQEVLENVNISSSNLKLSQQKQLESLLTNFVDVFETKNSPHGYYDKVKHKIDTGNNPPVKARPYRHSPKLQQTIREHVNKMLNDGYNLRVNFPISKSSCIDKKEKWRL